MKTLLPIRTFCGRTLEPRTFYGGEIEEGTFCGGEIEPGTFHGGEIEEGTFCGGEIEPGTFHSANVPSAETLDEEVTGAIDGR